MVDDSSASARSSESLAASAAFREAALRSEVRRVYGVLGILLLIAMFIAIRRPDREMDVRLQLVGVVGLCVLFLAQMMTLAFARWARSRGRMIPLWFLIATIIVESLVPTCIMLTHINSGVLAPYAALFSPPILAYGLMLSLTTLRLRPALCLLAAIVSAGGYAAIFAWVRVGLHIEPPPNGLPFPAYPTAIMFIFVSGLGAAWVAREIRTHMEAALREAQTQRQIERMEQDLSVARSIQRALLPRDTPHVPGFEIAGWNRPADQTGGDYYDWQQLPDGKWMITLADVSGHGIGPALVTAACRAYVRASGAHHRDLGSLTSHINRLLAEDLPEGRFVTMVSVVIGDADEPVSLLSAGHGPIVLYLGKTGNVQDIMPQDLPLAVARDVAFGPAQAFTMARGDVLALVTDGFVEWARSNGTHGGGREEFGLNRLRESLRRHAHLDAAGMIQAITEDVAAFAGPTPQQDDLTMVVIRRNG